MNLFDLMATLGLDSSAYEKGLNDAEGKANTFGSKLKSGLTNVAKAGAAALTAATTAAVGFGVSSINAGKEFDVAMSQIAATLGYTTSDIEKNIGGAGDKFDALREKASQMGNQTNFTATQAAEGLNILAMSGFNATESIQMIEDVLHLAAAGSMDMASAAGYVSGAMKGFNDSTKDSGYYANLMAKGATLANTSVSQLGEAMSSGASGAAAYSQTAESMTVALLRLAEQNEIGSAAGTALSAAMKNLYTPTDQASEVLKKLGVSAYENGKALDFNDVVNNLADALSEYSEEERNAYKQTIFGIQGLNAFNKMTVTGIEKQEQWAESLSQASDGIGEAAKQYDTMTDNLQGDLDQLDSALDGFKRSISDVLTGSAREFVQFGTTSVAKLTEGFESGGIEGVVSVLGDIISEGLALLVDKLPKVVDLGLKLLQALIKGIVQNLPQIASAAIEIIGTIGTSIIENLPTLMNSFNSAINQIAWMLSDPELLGQFIDGAILLLTTIGNAMVENIPTLVGMTIVVLKRLVEALQENLPLVIESGIEIITALVDGLAQYLPYLVEYVPTLIQAISEMIFENLPQILEAGIDIIIALVDGLLDSLPVVIESISTIVEGLLNFILENLPMFVDKGMDLVMAIVQGILDNLPRIIDAAMQLIVNLLAGIVQNLPQILQAGIELVARLVLGLIQAIPQLIAAIPKLFLAMVDAFNKLDVISIGKNIVEGIKNGITSMVGNLVQAAKDMVSNVVGGIKNFLGIHSPSTVFRDQVGKMLGLGLAEGIEDSTDDASSAAQDMADETINGMSDLDGIGERSGATLSKSLANGINSSLSIIADSVSKLVDVFITNLAKYFPKIVLSGGQTIERLIQGITNAIPRIVSALPNVIASITDTFNKYNWNLIGMNMMDGIRQGILSFTNSLLNTLRNMVNSVTKEVKNQLDIHSPSGVFRDQIGKMIGKGLAIGIDDGAEDAIESAEDMAKSVLGTMDGMDAALSTGISGAVSVGSQGIGLTSGAQGVTINVYGAVGQDVSELAEIVSQKIAFATQKERVAWA